MIVIVAPSGGGKSTLIRRLKADFPELIESISCTTRQIREGEKEGIHYFFLKEEEFKARIGKNDFLEWAKVHNNYYGTSKSFVEKCLKEKKSILFDLDVQGADALKKYFGDLVKVVFIAPPSLEELENRLRNRHTETEESIRVRLNTAEREMKRKDDYDYFVLNGEREKAYSDFKRIVKDILNG